MSLAIVCPSRGRPVVLKRMIASALSTSSADVLIYLDSDDDETYDLIDSPRVKVVVGPPIGRGRAINALCDKYRDYRMYLLFSDDAVFVRQNWDLEVEEAMDSFGDDIGLVHLSMGIPEAWVNWPIVSRKWLDAVGWFNFPKLTHYCQDTVLQALAEAIGKIRYIEPLVVGHEALWPEDGAKRISADAQQFLWFFAKDFGPTLKKLRAAT